MIKVSVKREKFEERNENIEEDEESGGGKERNII